MSNFYVGQEIRLNIGGGSFLAYNGYVGTILEKL